MENAKQKIEDYYFVRAAVNFSFLNKLGSITPF